MLFADLLKMGFQLLAAEFILLIFVVFIGFVLIVIIALLRGLFLKIMKWFNKRYPIK